MFLVLYVDDILLIGKDVGKLSQVKIWLAKQFDMKDLGEAAYILGIQIFRDLKNRTLSLSQASYIDKVMDRFSMQDSKKGQTPCCRPVSDRRGQTSRALPSSTSRARPQLDLSSASRARPQLDLSSASARPQLGPRLASAIDRP